MYYPVPATSCRVPNAWGSLWAPPTVRGYRHCRILSVGCSQSLSLSHCLRGCIHTSITNKETTAHGHTYVYWFTHAIVPTNVTVVILTT